MTILLPDPKAYLTTQNPIHTSLEHPGGVAFPETIGAASANTPEIGFHTMIAYPDESFGVFGKNLTGGAWAFWSEGQIWETSAIRSATDRSQATVTKELNAGVLHDRRINRELVVAWPKNANGYGHPIRLNQPRIFTLWPQRKWKYTDRIVTIYGHNLTCQGRRSKVLLQLENQKPIYANILDQSPYKIVFEMPPYDQGFEVGNWKVWAHNGSGGEYGWSNSEELVVATYHYTSLVTYNVDEMVGATDQLKIQAALDLAKVDGPATIQFEAREYAITANLELPERVTDSKAVFFLGSKYGTTTLKCAGEMRYIYPDGPGTEIRDMTLENICVNVLTKDVIIDNVHIKNRTQQGCIQTYYYLVAGGFKERNKMHLEVTNCTLEGRVPILTGTSFQLYKNNHIVGDFDGTVYDTDNVSVYTHDNLGCNGINIRSGHSIIIDGNTFESKNPAGGETLTRAVIFYRSHDSRNVIINNTIRNIGAFDTLPYRDTNSGETILFHGDLTGISGGTLSATTNTVETDIDPDDFAAMADVNNGTHRAFHTWDADPIGNGLIYVTVLSGYGKGQIRLVTAFEDNLAGGSIFTVAEDWLIQPTSGDIICIRPFHVENLVVGNNIDAVVEPDNFDIDFNRTGILFWAPQYNSIVADNVIKHCYEGIRFQTTCGGIYFQGPAYTLNNTISDSIRSGPYNFYPKFWEICADGVYEGPAMLHAFGQVFRGNTCHDAEMGVLVGAHDWDNDLGSRNDATFTMGSNTGVAHTIVEHNDFDAVDYPSNKVFALTVGANWTLIRNNTSDHEQAIQFYTEAKTHESLLIVNDEVEYP